MNRKKIIASLLLMPGLMLICINLSFVAYVLDETIHGAGGWRNVVPAFTCLLIGLWAVAYVGGAMWMWHLGLKKLSEKEDNGIR